LVGIAGAVEELATADAGAGFAFTGLAGFEDEAEAAAAAFERAMASSFVPNTEVKYCSRVVLSSAAFAHLELALAT